jgi:hypothetical protein
VREQFVAVLARSYALLRPCPEATLLAGVSCSGKSTYAKRLSVNDSSCVISRYALRRRAGAHLHPKMSRPIVHWDSSYRGNEDAGDWIFVRNINSINLVLVAPPYEVLMERVRSRYPDGNAKWRTKYSTPGVLVERHATFLALLAPISHHISRFSITDGHVENEVLGLAGMLDEVQRLYANVGGTRQSSRL